MRDFFRSFGLIVLFVSLAIPTSLLVHEPELSLAQSTSESATAPAAPADKNPNLESILVKLARIERERGAAAAADVARVRGVAVSGNLVRVIIEASAADASAARAAAIELGATVEAQYANLVQALVPVSALEPLAAHPAVRYVRTPEVPQPDAVPGEGVGSTGAAVWHGAGFTGTGAKVAVIDTGFDGYTTRQANGDLPANLTTVNFCSGGFTAGSEHGTAVAEIVHEMAPGAQLFLICVSTAVNLGQAKDYAKTNGIKVIVHSVSWFNTSRGDGSGGPGTPDAIVADARANGILWVNSSGNRGQQHWSGTFSDTDSDGFHNFTPTDNGNSITLPDGASICVYLKWDNWPTSAQDYDLYLRRSSDLVIVAASENVQSGSQRPTETLCYDHSGATQSFAIFISRFSATQTPRFDLYIAPGPNLEHQVAAGSLTEPGSSPNVMAVGAVCWQDSSLQPYSGRGPTIDGRTKPDIAGPDSVSSATYGVFSQCGASGFPGTSASTPHVGGAAALVAGANPGFGPSDIQNFLQARAVDVAPAGLDNGSGHGRLNLGAPPAGGGPTTTPTPTNTPPAVTSTPTATSTPVTGGVGGKGLTLRPTASGVLLNWQGGQGQTGYLVARIGSAPAVLPVNGPLPANATSYLDTSAPLLSGLVCYLLVPTGVNPQVVSDLLCAFLNTHSATGAPQNLTISFNQSNVASLSWTGPLGGGQTGYILFPLGGANPAPISLSGLATSASVSTTGVACFMLVALTGATPTGNGDILCGFPGVATISSTLDPTARPVSPALAGPDFGGFPLVRRLALADDPRDRLLAVRRENGGRLG